MLSTINFLRSKRNLLFIGLLWILLWVIPWGKLPTVQENLYLAFFTDMIRLGIAIGTFIVPGVLLFLLLRNHSDPVNDRAGIVPIGFALSVFIIAVVGLLGRIAGFSFGLVRNLFAFIGMAELILLMFFGPDLVISKDWLRQSFRDVVQNPPLLFAIILATLVTCHDSLFFIDDTTYTAYLTNWQHSGHLGFYTIVHPANVVEYARFWLAMYPMGQALLSDLSGVPGLLLMGNYLELFLVPLAVIVSYWFARVLGLSRKAAGFSVLIQISLYTWMIGSQWPVGTWFYESLAEDKVSVVFFLAPVFFAMVLRFIQKPTRSSRLLVIFSGLGITLTHPAMLFFSYSIVALVVLFAFLSRKASLRQVVEILMIGVALMMPYAPIRISDRTGEISGPYNGEQASTSFQIDRYTNVVSDVFYGLNPEVLMFIDIPTESDLHRAFQFFRVIPMILGALGGVIALRRVKQGPIYWYVFSSSLLVLLAALPYTGWLLGYFVSARLISRVSWFSPMGLAGVLVLKSIIDWLKTRATMDGKQAIVAERRRVLRGLMLIFIFVSPVLVFSVSQRLPLYFGRLEHNKQLAEIGAFIDENTVAPTTVIAINYRDIQLLPAVSAHINLISFREELDYNGFNNFMSLEEIHHRIYASNTIRSLDAGISMDTRCKLIKEFGVRFVVVPSEDAEEYKSIVSECGSVETVFSTNDLVLMEFR